MNFNPILSLFVTGLIVVSVNCDKCAIARRVNVKKSFSPIESSLISDGKNSNNGASKSRLKCLLSEQFSQPRNHQVNPVNKEAVRNYLLNQMHQYADEVKIQTYDQPGETNVKGVNIIGVISGTNRNTSDDNLILIGAHYDTYLTGINDITSGVNDNGSGLAVLLEVLRLVSNSISDHSFKPVNSIMFVAFDFEEYGYTGSHVFVDKYLIPYELTGKKSSSFQGAFIMDTILYYNSTIGSQSYPQEADLLAPGIGTWMKSNDFKGDFLTLISRQSIDSQLNQIFTKSWNQVDGQNSFKVLPVKLPTTTELIGQFLRSDHANFWFHDFQSYNQQLPAIFLTDTGNFRGIMEKCYHRACDDLRLITEDNLSWLVQITNTLYSSVISMSQ